MSDSVIPNADHCLAALRAGDRDRYLCALLTPHDARGAISALYAFNLEIARIRENITEPTMGEVRLQWWRDFLEGSPHGAAQANPVAAALAATIDRHGLSTAPFLNMIAARQFDLYDDPMPDRNAFEGYAGETASAIIQLCVNVLGPDAARRSADAAGHAGVAQLVAGTLLLLPVHRSQGQVYIPGDLLRATGLDRDAFLAARNEDAIGQAIAAFVALGREHLSEARTMVGQLPSGSFAAFLPLALAEPVFDRAERLGAALLSEPLQFAQWRRQLRLWRAARRGRL
ncbi:phytoene/squalene synthase family protein [Hoeflea poritis]|uniref:Phytoene/squalene synthase family protein n=1 Tax=Hoeflea poritis TaxID=2993659 RepID=A0ABT4VPL7_9HYPH|nr:phytoene/squalene synthase family protein [Hoeflea poritis]MDA4846655.1 phytoene/squalene synthase family protein [Hoeflea poritis]